MEEKFMKDIVLVSGGFDPVHSGHILLIQNAAKHGDVIVLLNSDSWLKQKKGKSFLSFKERKKIMGALKNVVDVIVFDDSDKTAIDGIKKVIKKYPNKKIKFANGGDRNNNTIPSPEMNFCKKNDIKLIWNVGGSNKANSSSWILKKWSKN
jgi:D-beta-D-heptose 7-phosphate kinase/D-beta-D-heptose 1-phosphate adenosyltransferase